MRKGEVKIWVVVLALAGVAGIGYIGYSWFYLPWQEYQTEFIKLSTQANAKRTELNLARKDLSQLNQFQHLSLPYDQHNARLAYENFLAALIERHNFRLTGPGLRYTGKAAAKASASTTKSLSRKASEPVYTALQFKLNAVAYLLDLGKMLKEFDEAPIKHRIKNMTVKPVDPDYEKKTDFLVSIAMDIEGLKVEGAANRSESLVGVDERLAMIDVVTALAGGPAGIAEIPWVVGPTGPLAAVQRKSKSMTPDPIHIASANIFVPYTPPPKKVVKEKDPEPMPTPMVEIPPEPVDEGPDTRPFYKLIIITKTDTRDEAWLYSVFHNTWTRLRTSRAFNKFVVYRASGEEILFRGTVLRIDYGVVYFEKDDEIFAINAGETMLDALRFPVQDAELKKVGLLKETASGK